MMVVIVTPVIHHHQAFICFRLALCFLVTSVPSLFFYLSLKTGILLFFLLFSGATCSVGSCHSNQGHCFKLIKVASKLLTSALEEKNKSSVQRICGAFLVFLRREVHDTLGNGVVFKKIIIHLK